jgi:hypothetical protein
MADRDPEMGIVGNEGGFACDLSGLGRAFGQAAAEDGDGTNRRIRHLTGEGALLRAHHEAADLQISGIKPVPVQMPRAGPKDGSSHALLE